MASQITHVLAGEKALASAFPDGVSALLERSGSWFRLGCQGPDIFYHNQRTMPSGLHYGSLAHRRNYGLFLATAIESIPEARGGLDTALGAYIMGLATHAALDRATHPFIVYFSGWHDPSEPASDKYRSCHPFLERLLDICLLKELRGITAAEYDLESLLAPRAADESRSVENAAVDEEIVALWAAGLKAAFPRSAGGDFLIERRIANALADSRYFFSITNPAVTAMNPEREDWFAYLNDGIGARSVSIVYPESIPAGIDFMNGAHDAWQHPAGDGRTSTSSYVDLVEEGADVASLSLAKVLEALASNPGQGYYKDLAGSLGNEGLSINDAAGQAIGPRIARPLPLSELMEAEFRRRLEWARRHLRH